jgi:hypothetical protein
LFSEIISSTCTRRVPHIVELLFLLKYENYFHLLQFLSFVSCFLLYETAYCFCCLQDRQLMEPLAVIPSLASAAAEVAAAEVAIESRAVTYASSLPAAEATIAEPPAAAAAADVLAAMTVASAKSTAVATVVAAGTPALAAAPPTSTPLSLQLKCLLKRPFRYLLIQYQVQLLLSQSFFLVFNTTNSIQFP